MSSQCRFVNDELVTGSCAAPAQGRRSRWVWTKSRSCRFPRHCGGLHRMRWQSWQGSGSLPVQGRQCADLPGGGIAVHHRHLHIHQHQIIAAGAAVLTFSTATAPFSAVSTGSRTRTGSPARSRGSARCPPPAGCACLEVGVSFPAKASAPHPPLLAKGAHQGLAQSEHEHGLGAEGGHAGCFCFHFNIRPVVGGQDDNRRIIVQAADLAGDLDAVQIRQTPVDDIGVETSLISIDCRARSTASLPERVHSARMPTLTASLSRCRRC